MDMQKIGMFLKNLRIERNLTQEELATSIGTTNKTISRWENGNYLPPAEMLLILSDFYQVSINEILNGEKISSEDYKKTAERNLLDAISESKFEVKYKENELTKKWLKSHIIEMIIEFILILSTFVLNIFYKIRFGTIALLFAWVIISYVRIRKYININIYGNKKGKQEKDKI